MTPWLGVAALALVAGSYAFGRHDGRTLEVAAQLKAVQVADAAAAAATDAAVEAIKGIRPIYQTITKGVERETIREPVYLDCRHSPDAWRLLDDAYQAAGGAPLGGGAGVPAAARPGG